MIDFIVLGLPRSATTWLANWLTTDRSLCLHDPFAHSMPEAWDGGGKRLGISCTGAYLLPKWLAHQDCPVAIIERDPAMCSASLAMLGMPPISDHMQTMLARAEGRRWRFADIWSEEKARELWAFLLPGISFDAPRYRLLKNMQIQPHSHNCDLRVMEQIKERGYVG